MTGNNVCNSGIAHAAHRAGGRPLCKNDRAHMSYAIEDFRKLEPQCKRCAAKLAKMDAKK